uniref:T-box domain-containing protein n=1 Tax=Mastacembelus armatus TaxID=205130 RepID=A0A7N8WU25_9TELE
MVFHEEGASTPAAAPAANHSCFVVPKLGMASEGGMEQETYVTNEEANIVGKPNMHPSKEVVRFTGGLPTVKQPISSNSLSDNLSPDSVCKGVRVILDNNSMWNEFFRCKTEMILTKQGSRMFPYCRFRISGLHPHKKYSLIMDIQPLDNSCYKWTGKSWQVVGKAECHVKSQPFNHPESPSVGQHWMQNPVSFYKLKLTNNISDQDGNTILHPMHRYLPRLHVVQTDKASKDVKLNGPNVVTFTFPQTEFMAVMSYQNLRFAQLKVACNPFAKGLKEDGHSLWGLKMKLNTGKESHKDGGVTTNELHPVKKSLKSLLANHKPRSSKAMALKPSPSGDLQKNSTADEDQSADKVTGQSSW